MKVLEKFIKLAEKLANWCMAANTEAGMKLRLAYLSVALFVGPILIVKIIEKLLGF